MSNGIPGLHRIGVALLVIGEILHIVGLATPNWTIFSTPYGTSSIGLWKMCSTLGLCVDIPSNIKSDAMNVVDAFTILCTLAGAGTLALACWNLILRIREKEEKQWIRKSILKVGIFALVSAVISGCVYLIIVYPKLSTDIFSTSAIGYSFILSAVGGGVICTGSVVFYVACGRNPSY